MYGATYVSVSYLGQKASGDGSAAFLEDNWLWASRTIFCSESTFVFGGVCRSPSGLCHGAKSRAKGG